VNAFLEGENGSDDCHDQRGDKNDAKAEIKCDEENAVALIGA